MTVTTGRRHEIRSETEPLELTDTARRVLLNLRVRLAEEVDRMFSMDSWFRWYLDENGNSPHTPEQKQTWTCGYSACLAGTIVLVEHPEVWDELDKDGVNDWMGSGRDATIGAIALGALQECPPWEANTDDPLWLLFFGDNWPNEFRLSANPHISERERAIMLLDAILDGQVQVVTTQDVAVEPSGEEWDFSREVKLEVVSD